MQDSDDTSGIGTTRSQFPGRSVPGHDIGPYTLLELIGEGGMGEVWLAEQKEPVRRRVAVKLIKSGMDTQEVVARFESERQALALMDHPNIAKVFDGGSTSGGRPYFVMEYVAGLSITAYCDKHKLTTQQRMELFIHVCEGVQHAHQKAIIHRDLKPSNILVSEVDGKPMPRIIDFGVAKATSQRLTDRTMYTHVGAIVGTLGYMSPEQADSAGQDIDTRTDVYSLGVVLYELLVGALPLDFRKMAFDQALKILREEDAPRPSTKLRSLGDKSVITAQNRSAEIPVLTRTLQGDVDAIVMKAVEKDRARRYATPLELSSDIQRYLLNEPVIARPASAAYRAKKYVQRHRALVAGVAAVFVVLLAGIIVSTWEAKRARTAAAVAQATSDFLENDLLAQADAANQSGADAKPDPDIKVRAVLDRAAAKIEGKFDNQPEVEASIRDTMGKAYEGLGVYLEARKQIERAFDLRRKVLGKENPKTLTTALDLAWLDTDQGKYAEAEALYSQTLEIARRELGREHPDTLRTITGLGIVYQGQGKYAQAEALHSEALEIRRRVLGPEHPSTLSSMNNLANDYSKQGKYAEAEALRSQTVEIGRRVLGPEHPRTLTFMNNLGWTYIQEGKYEQGEELLSQTLEIQRRVLGPEHPGTLMSMENLGFVYWEQGKKAQVEALDSQILEIRRRVLGPEHPDTLSSMNNLAFDYYMQEKYEQGEELLSQTLEIQRRVLGPEHPGTLMSMNSLGDAYRKQGKYAQAETLLNRVLEIQRRVLGPEHPDTLSSLGSLAMVLSHEGRYSEAEKLFREAIVAADKKSKPHLTATAWYRFACGATLAGHRDQALEYLKNAIEQGLTPADVLNMTSDSDLKSLHGDQRFAALLAQAKAKAAAAQK